MARIRWSIRQLIPLTYRTRVQAVEKDGSLTPQFIVWRMWLGRCFDIDRVTTV